MCYKRKPHLFFSFPTSQKQRKVLTQTRNLYCQEAANAMIRWIRPESSPGLNWFSQASIYSLRPKLLYSFIILFLFVKLEDRKITKNSGMEDIWTIIQFYVILVLIVLKLGVLMGITFYLVCRMMKQFSPGTCHESMEWLFKLGNFCLVSVPWQLDTLWCEVDDHASLPCTKFWKIIV